MVVPGEEMEQRRSDLMRSARLTMEACLVKSKETVVVYTDTNKPRATVEAFFGEAVATSADVNLVLSPTRRILENPSTSAVEAMKAADIVFDMTSVPWLYSDATFQVLSSGTRMLQILASEDAILARPPISSVRERVELSEKLFTRAKTLKLVTDGKELTAEFSGRKPMPQFGAVDHPGDWDSLTLGMCNVFPKEDSVEGQVTVNGTMFLIPGYQFICNEPTKLTYKEGRVTKIEGGSEARTLERWLWSFDDEKMFVSSHIGFGLDPRAGPPPIPNDIAGWESMNGNAIFALGSNVGLPGGVGGVNNAKAHADLTTLGGDFYLDDEKIIGGGKFVYAGLKG
jgi:2,5-dihydroxypyridine 5,6-dioxygenase